MDFLPERSTGFIFAVYGEKFGYLGIAVVGALRADRLARFDHRGGCQIRILTVVGRIFKPFVFVYYFVNIGVVSGLLPVVGVPLPLVSYGGTSMVTLMAAFGMLMSIHSQRRWQAR